jgi:hypothetical protein
LKKNDLNIMQQQQQSQMNNTMTSSSSMVMGLGNTGFLKEQQQQATLRNVSKKRTNTI